jgi:hypothetical protein
MQPLDSLPLRVREGFTPQVPDKTKRITGKQDFNRAKKSAHFSFWAYNSGKTEFSFRYKNFKPGSIPVHTILFDG